MPPIVGFDNLFLFMLIGLDRMMKNIGRLLFNVSFNSEASIITNYLDEHD